MEDTIKEFAEVFCKSLRMLQEEIEENKEILHNFYNIDELVKEWNNLCDKYLDEE